MSANKNCLENKECPGCGYSGEVLVNARSWVSLKDDGTDPFADSLGMRGDVEYGGHAEAACPSCGHEGRLGEWDIEEGPPPADAGLPVKIYFESGSHAEFAGILPDGVYSRAAELLDGLAEESRMIVTTSVCESPEDLLEIAALLAGRPVNPSTQQDLFFVMQGIGINAVCCAECGETIFHGVGHTGTIECHNCGLEDDISCFSDLYD